MASTGAGANGGNYAPAPIDATPVPPAPVPAPAPPAATNVAASAEIQTELLRVLEVVTSMCDHVIEYLEADRRERVAMLDTLTQLTRALTREAVPPAPIVRERVLGGSMPAGPEPVVVTELPAEPFVIAASLAPEAVEPGIPAPVPGHDPLIDLRDADRLIDLRDAEPRPDEVGIANGSHPTTAVEVRCRFGEGDRWVAGFEIVEVLNGGDPARYRLRRQRDGAVLPQLFEAANIRHIETFEQLTTPDDRRWSRL